MSERLTNKHKNGMWFSKKIQKGKFYDIDTGKTFYMLIGDAVDKLAAYEDIGTPKEYAELDKNMDILVLNSAQIGRNNLNLRNELAAYKQADREGRILPSILCLTCLNKEDSPPCEDCLIYKNYFKMIAKEDSQ